jgi:hypothetical protein
MLMSGITSSLIPAFSPRRRRIIHCLIEIPATGLAERLFAKQKFIIGMSSPGGEETGEGGC